MKKLLIKLWVGATLICALSLQSLTAISCPTSDCCNPCWDPCDFCGDFELGAHYLYWKPITCALPFARKDFDGGDRRETITIKPDYDSGVRAWVGYYSDCSFAQVSYLWLETKDSFGVEAGNANSLVIPGDVIGGLTNANSRLKYRYQNVDLRLGQYVHRSCGCDFQVFGNIRWVDVTRRFRVEGEGVMAGTNTKITQKSKFKGAGLGVGMNGEFSLWGCFNAFGEFNAMAIIGEREFPDYSIRGTTQGPTPFRGDVNVRSRTCVVPGIDFRLGVNYTWDCLCTTIVLEVGYDFNQYWNILRHADLPANPDNSIQSGSKIVCSDLGFAGPFIGGRVMF